MGALSATPWHNQSNSECAAGKQQVHHTGDQGGESDRDARATAINDYSKQPQIFDHSLAHGGWCTVRQANDL
ncbi:MAG: hypothetical protein Tsb0027_06050 [Wenzhouxiangellaceae bacterium]